jgi:ornithine cyclodeaminase/alanine dehydrogenase-like protein (mu-crystallin family)
MADAAAGLVVFDAAAVRRALTPEAAIAAVRRAMIALSSGEVRQLLRSFIGLGEGRTFAIMPAAMGENGVFGAKLVSVFTRPDGHKAHEGLVVLFGGEQGVPVCVADAGEVTALRTAAASAVATDALARPDSRVLAILGAGRQAFEHARAIQLVRKIEEIRIWARKPDLARDLAVRVRKGAKVKTSAATDVQAAVSDADIICTVTGAHEPILRAEWVAPGAHLNVVGSSNPMHAEIDIDLVAMSRFVVDHSEHALAHGAELRRAIEANRVDKAHIAAEIGQVLAGRAPGRTSATEITVYKSLGHAAQDIAVTAWLYENAR